jgi:hypothetical protein
MSDKAIFQHPSDSILLSERNLDAKGRTFYSLPRKHVTRPWNSRDVGNCGGNRLHLQQDRAKHAEQGLPFCLFVRTLGAVEFRFQLRQRLGLCIPQNELDRGNHYRFAPCRIGNFFATATAQPKHSMTRFML